MSVYTELIDIQTGIDRMKKHKADLLSTVSDLDKMVNNIYHMIELLPLSASEMSIVTKQLREILQDRRDKKEVLIAVSNFLTSPVEKTKPHDIGAQNAEDRKEKYRKEALASYQKMFGKQKVLT
jgi:hypothetical protein